MRLRLSQAPVHRAHRRAVLVVLVLLLVAAGAMVAWRSCVRAAPGTSVAGMDVSGLTASQIAARVTSLQDAFRVEIRVGDRSVQARARDLGVTVDAAATGRAAARTGSWFGALTRHGGGLEAIPLVVRSNATVMRSWLDTAFAAEVAASVSPRVDFDPAAGKYVVTPGSAGSGVDAAGLIARLPELIAARDAAAIELPLVRSVPAITDDEARRIAAQLDGLVATPLSVVSPYDQTVLARPVPADIAAWISATPAAGGATFDIDVSAARIDDFVAQKVAPALAVAPVDEQDLTGSGGASLGVLVPGTPGRALANADEIAQAWFDALVSHQAGTVTAAFASTGFGTVPVPAAAVHPGVVHAGHWVDVDLTRQMAILFDGTEAVRAFIISSGAPGHETPTGHFRVYARVASQTIAGDGYRYDNVKWCVWFQGNYGFHTAYWHDDFGQPVSHGCLNMREADAKAVYDWVSLGSDIEIHT